MKTNSVTIKKPSRLSNLISHRRQFVVLGLLIVAAAAMFRSWAVVSGQNDVRMPGGMQKGVRILPPGKGGPEYVPIVGKLRPTTFDPTSISLSKRILRLFVPT